MISDPSEGQGLGHFLYRSTARAGLGRDEIDQIVAAARTRNQELGLTGCLHHEDGLFFQWLEGPQQPLDGMIAKVRDDARHADMTELSSGPLSGRRFVVWPMRLTDSGRASMLDWFVARQVSTVDRGAYAGGVSDFLLAIDA